MVRLTEPKFPKARRGHRGLTQAVLDEGAGATSVVIALFEAGERGASEKWRPKWGRRHSMWILESYFCACYFSIQ